MASSTSLPRTVYISYMPDRAHKREVAQMTRLLAEAGFEVYSTEPGLSVIRSLGKGADYWKEQCILKAENILVICSKKYYKEDHRLATEGSKSPIAVDRYLLRHLVYHGCSRRVIPVVTGVTSYSSCEGIVPQWMMPLARFHWPEQKMQLLRSLESMPEYEKPRVEQKIQVKPIQINFPEASNWNIDD